MNISYCICLHVILKLILTRVVPLYDYGGCVPERLVLPLGQFDVGKQTYALKGIKHLILKCSVH